MKTISLLYTDEGGGGAWGVELQDLQLAAERLAAEQGALAPGELLGRSVELAYQTFELCWPALSTPALVLAIVKLARQDGWIALRPGEGASVRAQLKDWLEGLGVAAEEAIDAAKSEALRDALKRAALSLESFRPTLPPPPRDVKPEVEPQPEPEPDPEPEPLDAVMARRRYLAAAQRRRRLIHRAGEQLLAELLRE